MWSASVGVDVDDFRVEFKQATARAAEMKFRRIEAGAVRGALAPRELSISGRRHVLHYLSGLGLSLDSLGADLSSVGWTDPGVVEGRIEATNEIIDLAADLGAPIVTTSLGDIVDPKDHQPSRHVIDAFRHLGERADARGRLIAVRPTHHDPALVETLMRTLDCPAIRLGIDPAGLVMSGQNPVALIERMHDRVALVHGRDGTPGTARRSGRETRLGDGAVDLIGLLAVLEAADYHGPIILRRTDSRTPARDLEEGREMLERMGRV